jgi:hypothetical protein
MKTRILLLLIIVMLHAPLLKAQNTDYNNDSIFYKGGRVVKCEIVAITKEYYFFRLNPDKQMYKAETVKIVSYKNNPTPNFDPLQPGLIACFDIGGICGFVNVEGDIILPAIFENGENFSEGMANVRYGKFWGYIDIQGNWVITPKYERAEPFKNGYARVKLGNKWGVINKTGNWILDPHFFRLWDFMPINN